MKKIIDLFLILLTFLFCLAVSLYAKEIQRDDFQSRLNQIYTLFAKNPASSCHELEQALQSQDAAGLSTQEAKTTYYFLANCNYQLKNFDKAITYYQKTAELDPKNPQPLLDAGTVYVQEGLYADGEKEYNEALQKVAGDKSQEKKVRQMIAHIPGKLQKNFMLTTGIGYDSNVNSGPDDTVHSIYGGFKYTLDPNAKPHEDFYLYNAIAGAFSKALNPATYLLFNAGVNNTSYFTQTDFNSSVLSTSFGYRKIFDNKSVTLSPFVNYQTLDDRSYQISSGINLFGAAKITDKINIWPQLGWYAQNFYKDNVRDAIGVSTGTSASYELNKKTSIIASAFYSYNKAKDNQFTYNNLFLGGSINRILTENLTGALGYNLQLLYYDDRDPAFGSSRRDNGHTVYISFDYSLKKLLKMDNTILNLSVSHNHNNSNQSFHDNSRLFSALKLVFSF